MCNLVGLCGFAAAIPTLLWLQVAVLHDAMHPAGWAVGPGIPLCRKIMPVYILLNAPRVCSR